MKDDKLAVLECLTKFCVDKINNMRNEPNKGLYGNGCIDAWTEVINEIDELLHSEIYQ